MWNTIRRRLTFADLIRLANSLLPAPKTFRPAYNSLKQLPKKPTLNRLQERLAHLECLLELGDFKQVPESIPPLKIKHFAGEAKVLDAGEFKSFRAPKRYSVLVCLVRRAHIKTRDALAQMFARRIAKMNRSGKNALEKIQIANSAESSERFFS